MLGRTFLSLLASTLEREREGKKQRKKRKEKKNIIYKLIRLNSNTMVYGCLTFGIRVI
jgi:hypothetical protein